MKARMCDAVEVGGKRYIIAKILHQDFWGSRNEWDIEFIDSCDNYHHWKQGFDGGRLIKKGDCMIPLPFNADETMEIVVVFDKPYLFTDMRIDRDTLPEGAVAYDVRDNCDGEFCQIKEFVLVNHWGTIIGLDRILMAFDGVTVNPDDWGFNGDALTWREFLKEYKENSHV